MRVDRPAADDADTGRQAERFRTVIRYILGIAVSLVAVVGVLPWSSLGASASPRAASRARIGSVAFRLDVPGTVATNATFWVAYGPIAGRFGIVQLRPVGGGEYVGRAALPANSRGTFTYLTGTGRMHTRMGWVPRQTGIVIKTVGPTTPLHAAAMTVRFAPIG
jgi:hypothetical protein